MNLIEKLGLEKCKQIVDGSPNGAYEWRTNGFYYTSGMYYCAKNKEFFESYTENSFTAYTISAIRTAIANHGTPTNKGTDNLSHFDHCSDIANHISPLTKVTER